MKILPPSLEGYVRDCIHSLVACNVRVTVPVTDTCCDLTRRADTIQFTFAINRIHIRARMSNSHSSGTSHAHIYPDPKTVRRAQWPDLLSLPPELRTMIYREVLVEQSDIRVLPGTLPPPQPVYFKSTSNSGAKRSRSTTPRTSSISSSRTTMRLSTAHGRTLRNGAIELR